MKIFILTSVLVIISKSVSEAVSLSNDAFQFISQPSDTGPSSYNEDVYQLTPKEDLKDRLIDDIVRSELYGKEDIALWLKTVQNELREKLYGKGKHLRGQDTSKQSMSTSTTEAPSFIDRGVSFLKGLMGDDSGDSDSSDEQQPSSDDQSIIDDIERYLNHVVNSTDSTLEQLLRGVVRYVHRNVHFWLFSKRHQGYEDLTIGKSSNVSDSDFNKRKKTIIIIHGWINSGDNYYSQKMINAYEKYGDFNIISVDWSKLSYSLYTLSRIAVNFVGPYVTQMIEFLVKHHDLRLGELHILGHSLGAHIAGIAGMFVKHGKVGRITGFDPASPLFGLSQVYRLDASDAKFVDVIHTSMLGMSNQLGHADFYPNGGGPSQPGCGIDIADCPHRRSYEYYIASMTDNHFIAFPCNSWEGFTAGNCTYHHVNMGIRLQKWSQGKYYLRTAGDAPFALGMKALDSDSDPTPLPVKKPYHHRH